MSVSGRAHYAYCIPFNSMYHAKHALTKMTNYSVKNVQYATQQRGVKYSISQFNAPYLTIIFQLDE